MNINVQVNKNPNENAMGVIRRFTKRVQGSGILRRVRGMRYRERPVSSFLGKKRKLASLRRKKIYDELLKLGKIEEHQSRKNFRR
ncbi:MAG TPA: hypothetical protein VJH21_02180 [Candidatus Paceibacterota bacterium]